MDDRLAVFTGADVGALVMFMQKSPSIHGDVHPSRKGHWCSISLLFDWPPDRLRKFHRKAVTSMGRLSQESGAWYSCRFDNLISDRKMFRGIIDGAGR